MLALDSNRRGHGEDWIAWKRIVDLGAKVCAANLVTDIWIVYSMLFGDRSSLPLRRKEKRNETRVAGDTFARDQGISEDLPRQGFGRSPPEAA